MIRGWKKLMCEERLRKIGLTTLEKRHNRADLLEVYKIMTGKEGLDKNKLFNLNERESRGHQFKIVKKQVRLDVRKYSFSNRIVERWNKLPRDVVMTYSRL